MVNFMDLAKKSKQAILNRYKKGGAVNAAVVDDKKSTGLGKFGAGITEKDDNMKVVGKKAMPRLDKKPRKASGGSAAAADMGGMAADKKIEDANEVVNAASARKKRMAGVGAMKKGGKVCKADGGEIEGIPEADKIGLNEKVNRIKEESDADFKEKNPNRGKISDYKKGGKVKKACKADGGNITEDDGKGNIRTYSSDGLKEYAVRKTYDVDPKPTDKELVENALKNRKSGGKVKHDDEAQDKKLIKKMLKQEEKAENYKKGGAVKGKTNINIVIAPSSGKESAMLPMPPMLPPMPMGGAPVPPPMPMDIPPPMMGRKSGGRVKMDAGDGSALGRMEKAKNAKANR